MKTGIWRIGKTGRHSEDISFQAIAFRSEAKQCREGRMQTFQEKCTTRWLRNLSDIAVVVVQKAVRS